MRVFLTFVISLFFTISLSAQNTFFETITSHGEDATYQRYYSVYKDDNEKQIISGKQYIMTAETLYAEHVKSGFRLSYLPKANKTTGTPYHTDNAAADHLKSCKLYSCDNIVHK